MVVARLHINIDIVGRAGGAVDGIKLMFGRQKLMAQALGRALELAVIVNAPVLINAWFTQREINRIDRKLKSHRSFNL